MADATYNAKVHITQGGDLLEIASGGSLVADSGSTVTINAATVTKTNVGIGASTAAAGSTSADPGALPAGTAEVYPTTAADDTKGVKISSSDNVTGRRIFIANGVSNKILKVYPPTGGTINGAAANAAFSSSSGVGVVVVCLDSTANTGAGSFAAW
jgi:hypothetical protein